MRGGVVDRETDLKQNVLVTKSVCDYARSNNCKHLVFASSAAVYGEPEIFPTPEHSFLRQTSIYGASKLAGEAYIKLILNILISKVQFLDLFLGLAKVIHME